MSDPTFHFIVKEGVEEMYMGLLMMEDNKLFDVSFESKNKTAFIFWNTKKSHALCELEASDDPLKKLSSTNAEYFYASGGCRLEKVAFIPGRCFQRVWRPQFTVGEHLFYNNPEKLIDEIRNDINQARTYLPYDPKIELGGVTQLSLLLDQLKTVFKTVQPANENLLTFGYEIRNLLVLACTEVEAQLKGIYKVNSNKSSRNLNIEDYFTLNRYLKLDQYQIQYPFYPHFATFKPFEKWSSESYNTLPWYKAYNDVKHNRESEFHQATLKNVIEAISAVAILLLAQYGDRPLYWRDLIGQFIKVVKRPGWHFDEYYMPPMKDSDWFFERILD